MFYLSHQRKKNFNSSSAVVRVARKNSPTIDISIITRSPVLSEKVLETLEFLSACTKVGESGNEEKPRDWCKVKVSRRKKKENCGTAAAWVNFYDDGGKSGLLVLSASSLSQLAGLERLVYVFRKCWCLCTHTHMHTQTVISRLICSASPPLSFSLTHMSWF